MLASKHSNGNLQIMLFIKTARPWLWLPLFGAVSMVSMIAKLPLSEWMGAAVLLCTIMTSAFFVNDWMDEKIDLANGKSRWTPRTTLHQVAILALVGFATIGSFLFVQSWWTSVSLIVILTASLAYSLGAKRIPAAAAAIVATVGCSPLYIFWSATWGHFSTIQLVFYLLIIGILWLHLFFKENWFDQFDIEGDIQAGRHTLASELNPSLFRTVLRAIGIAICILIATCIILSPTAWSLVLGSSLIGLHISFIQKNVTRMHMTLGSLAVIFLGMALAFELIVGL